MIIRVAAERQGTRSDLWLNLPGRITHLKRPRQSRQAPSVCLTIHPERSLFREGKRYAVTHRLTDKPPKERSFPERLVDNVETQITAMRVTLP